MHYKYLFTTPNRFILIVKYVKYTKSEGITLKRFKKIYKEL